MMQASEFAARCRAVAENQKTVYMKGCFGAPVTQAIIDRLGKLYPSWYTEKKKEALAKLIGTGAFGFDCVCFLKGILWGWNGDARAIYGGAAYTSNGVPDFSVPGMKAYCEEISEDFGEIEVGEVVFLPGHVGVYVGGGLCAECTTSFGGGVLLSACSRKVEGYPTRVWSWHGKLKFVEYPPAEAEVRLPVLRRGDEGEAVAALQALLNLRTGSELAVDGVLGPVTDGVVKRLREKMGLDGDVVVDAGVWEGVIAR